jgi:hypothetical protein
MALPDPEQHCVGVMDFAPLADHVPRGTMDEVSSLSVPCCLSTNGKHAPQFRFICLIPYWESRSAYPEEKQGLAREVKIRDSGQAAGG